MNLSSCDVEPAIVRVEARDDVDLGFGI